LENVSRQNIALIGFMAVGKSAVGRNLAKKLRRRFVDLDRAIEKTAGMKVRQIFASKGEDYFRRLEKETLAAILERDGQVLATGGGVVLDEENLALLRETTILIGLTASIDRLCARAGNGAKRPLLKGANRRERIEHQLRQRQSRYDQAHFTVDTSALTAEQVAEEIMARIKLRAEPHANADR
jgi:shikimate kinase